MWPSEKELHLAQRIQNTAARLILSAHSRDSINSLLKNLHWLPFENGFSRFVSRVLEHWLILLHLMYYNSVKLKPGPISKCCRAQSTNHFGQQTNRLPAKNQLHLYNVLLLATLSRSLSSNISAPWNSSTWFVRWMSELEDWHKSSSQLVQILNLASGDVITFWVLPMHRFITTIQHLWSLFIWYNGGEFVCSEWRYCTIKLSSRNCRNLPSYESLCVGNKARAAHNYFGNTSCVNLVIKTQLMHQLILKFK